MADRLRLIRLIHVARRDLKLDEDTYRQLLEESAGARSTKDLSVAQLEQVLRRLKQAGFKKRLRKGARALADDAQSRKIRALWLEMYGQGIVRSAEETALNAWVKKMTRVEALQWITSATASRLIEHLKKWQAREMKKREATNAAQNCSANR